MTQLDEAPVAADEASAPNYDTIVASWVSAFADAVDAKDVARVTGLFSSDPWWRDLYALTWDVTALHGAEKIAGMLEGVLQPRDFGNISFDDSVKTELVADMFVQGFYTFTTDVGVGRGVVRLVQEDGEWKCWTISTDLRELKDFPEWRVTISDAAKDEHNLPAGRGTRPSWDEQQAERVAYRDHDPSVLILGAGHSGVFLAARLKKLGVDTLVVDTYKRAGDNWRLRYSNLMLHDTKWWAQFPYMMYPDTWPLFTPKEMLADWIEAYVNFLQLNLWTSTFVQSATYDEEAGRWTVVMDRDGHTRTLHPNHLVFATGNHGVPTMPEVPGAEKFQGQIVHSKHHEGGEAVKGKKVIVVGGGSSAHDIAQDAYENGADVTIVQRSATYVLSQRNGVPVFHGANYSETSPPIEEADMLATSMAMELVTQMMPASTRMIADADKELIDGLEDAGFSTTLGPDDKGMMYMALVKGGGYYIDKGAARLIIDKEIRLQRGEIDHFTETGVVYKDGTEEQADIVVFSTGYTNMREAARPVVGDEVTDSLGLVWGLDDQGELRTTFRHSGHPKLWFMAGGFQQSRVHSRHLALMMKAIDEGLLDPKVSIEKRKD
jgi:cation diffusion facilitator CzcD-associated flavoprotein CzcO